MLLKILMAIKQIKKYQKKILYFCFLFLILFFILYYLLYSFNTYFFNKTIFNIPFSILADVFSGIISTGKIIDLEKFP